MSNFISENVLEEIRSRSDIVEIVGGYIPLKRTGANYKALCPFHHEKTPSFVVSQTKQIYHCFGCNAGGDVIKFVMQNEHLDFLAAAKMLADKAGVVIPEKEMSREESANKGVWDVNKSANEIFHKWLCHSERGKYAYGYLKKRAITDATIKKFSLGYAPGNGELIRELNKKGFSTELLLKAGLAVKTERGIADMFRNRLMFPVFNPSGKVAGFSGRVLDDGLPKYLNTPETTVFHKGKILYGLNASKAEIIKDSRAVICEGYFDFLRIFQEGLHAVVASQGTAFTPDHVHLLRRFASSIVLCFDGDTAGNNASMRGIQIFLEEGIHVRVVELPKGYDPDTFINAKGIQEFRELVDNAKDILDIKLGRLCAEHSVSSGEGKLKIIAGILPDILNIKNEVQKRQFVKKTADRLFVPEESIWLEIKRLRKPDNAKRSVKTGFTTEKVVSKLSENPAEKHLVQMLMDDNPISEEVPGDLITTHMKHPVYKAILEIIINLKKTGRWKGLNSLIAGMKDEEMQNFVSHLAAEEIPEGLDKQKNIRDCIYTIKKRHNEEKIKGLISQIKEGEKQGLSVDQLITEMHDVHKGLTRLSKEKAEKGAEINIINR
jgi:DNA primase